MSDHLTSVVRVEIRAVTLGRLLHLELFHSAAPASAVLVVNQQCCQDALYPCCRLQVRPLSQLSSAFDFGQRSEA